MKILVLGGDGFCGWPTSLRMSLEGHDVMIIDNFSRRHIDAELSAMSLTPITSMEERLLAWKEATNNVIRFVFLDIAKDLLALTKLLSDLQPDVIVHFAEQRAAPYSMKSAVHKAYTVSNNLNATNNLLAALVEAKLDCHVIHLGTMGVYGYGSAGFEIPEGYLKVRYSNDDIEREILYPADPGSIYHLTKCQDQLLFSFYNKNDGIRITDLHQGIVWGTQTNETKIDDRLVNRFDYDGDYGTVLNRFIMQSVLGYPLTVHGSGEQTRAFINIQDTVNSILLAVSNPPKHGERVRIINQMTETKSVLELAQKISRLGDCEIKHIDNPRKEASQNELQAGNQTLISYGLKPITIEEGSVAEIVEIAERFKDRCDLTRIPCLSRW